MDIKFEKIEIQNFKSVGKMLSLDFNDFKGLNFVYGKNLDVPNAKNGSGKSSIFCDSLFFALFGKTLKNTSNKYIPNRNVFSKLEPYVKLYLRSSGQLYSIKTYGKVSSSGMSSGVEILKLADDESVIEDLTQSSVAKSKEYIEKNIIGCSFDNNHSQLFGSIYFNADDSMLNIENSIFKYNRSHDVGAVFSCDGDNNAVTCKHCEFIENIAHMMAAVGYFAGHGYGNTVDLKDCTFANNVGKSYNSDFHAPYKENNFFLFEYCNFDCYSSNVLNYEANVSGYHSMGNRKFFNEKYLFVTRDPENYSENINIKNCIFKD